MILVLLLASALAQPVQVVTGKDLSAYRALQATEPGSIEEIDALRRFLSDHPSSALAEVAWSRLVALGAHTGEWTRQPGLKKQLARLESSRLQHQADLDRSTAAVASVTLSPEGEAVASRPHSWGVAMHMGGGHDGRELFGAFGVRAMFGPVGASIRAGADGAPFVEGALRLEAPLWAAPHLEVSTDTLRRQTYRLGARAELEPDLWIELGGGVGRDVLGWVPVVRLELVHPI